MTDDKQALQSELDTVQAEMHAINQEQLALLPEIYRDIVESQNISDPVELQKKIQVFGSMLPFEHSNKKQAEFRQYFDIKDEQ